MALAGLLGAMARDPLGAGATVADRALANVRPDWLLRNEPEHLGNLMTGRGPRPWIGGAVWGLGIGYGAVKGVSDYYNEKRVGVVQYSGNLPNMAYDGRGNYNPQTRRSDNLGAEGDLVFAMRNLR